ncbi:cell wall-active antibiotics response protein LiaF [Marinicrinis sediminis]|uniref:Cell wall-active antibiotics response protein LiaF n=1 Tax=Marinicrinis sediminis TaxID=1652465 RepID=A0ABW5R9N6_9BACL
MKLSSRIFWGLLLIGMGVAFFLDQIGYWHINIGMLFADFWPVILIYYCTIGLLSRQDGANMLWSLLGLAFGIYFLGHNLGYIHMEFSQIYPLILPVVLIVVGLSIMLSPKKNWSHWKEDQRYEQNHARSEWTRSKDEMKEQWRMAREELRNEKTLTDEELKAELRKKMEDLEREEQRLARGETTATDVGSMREGNHARYDSDARMEDDHEYGYMDEEHYGGYGGRPDKRKPVNHNQFIGDFTLGHQFYRLEPMNISHFVGDTVIDLTKADIAYGETKITVSAFIGDVKIFVPEDTDLELNVHFSSFLGDMKVFDRKDSGLMKNMSYQSPAYAEAPKKIRISASMFIGDIKIRQVG